jgi:hypothetical protein
VAAASAAKACSFFCRCASLNFINSSCCLFANN